MLSRFYGFTYQQILEMPIDVFHSYIKSMKIIKGRERLEEIEIAIYPNIKKKKDKETIKRKYIKMASASDDKEGVTGIEMARKLQQWQAKK